MTLRAALYARYSSDQQRAASIEDQFRVCRERGARRLEDRGRVQNSFGWASRTIEPGQEHSL